MWNFILSDARMQNMEARIDTLSDQLSNFTLMLKKSSGKSTGKRMGERPKEIGTYGKGGSYCRKSDHGAN